MSVYSIAWWNVENLFDAEDSPIRTDKLKRALGKDLEGWDENVLGKKINQLSKAISKMNNDTGPDILGVCEVENRNVLDKMKDSLHTLPHYYEIIHADTQDRRGIDVAFLYDANKFEVEPSKVFFHYIVKRSATREIVQVNFKSKSSEEYLVLVGNHWPSRSGGQLESEPYRMMAGETLAYFNQRIQEELGDKTAIIAMGDFNDEPYNRSITDYALSTVSRKKVERSISLPWLYNLMWPILSNGMGTFYYNGLLNLLDQFMVSKGIVTEDSKFQLVSHDDGRASSNGGGGGSSSPVQVLAYPELIDNDKTGKPKKFGKPSDKTGINEDGFSDHFPISLVLSE